MLTCQNVYEFNANLLSWSLRDASGVTEIKVIKSLKYDSPSTYMYVWVIFPTEH